MKEFWTVYILTSRTNTVLYTGITNNLKRRVWEHKRGLKDNSFTRKYHLYKLIWLDSFPTPEEVIPGPLRVPHLAGLDSSPATDGIRMT